MTQKVFWYPGDWMYQAVDDGARVYRLCTVRCFDRCFYEFTDPGYWPSTVWTKYSSLGYHAELWNGFRLTRDWYG